MLELDAEDVGAVAREIRAVEPEVRISRVASNRAGDPGRRRHPWRIASIGGSTLLLAGGLVLDRVDASWATPTLTVMLLLAYGLSGRRVIASAWRGLRGGSIFNENVLMVIATAGAIAIGEMHEAVGVMIFSQVADLVEARTVRKSRSAISSVLDLRPPTARLLGEDGDREVSVEEVEVGALIVIRPGDRVPLDGRVTSGTSGLDTSALTGESVPRRVGPGDEVLAGAINTSGALTVEVLSTNDTTALARMLALVESAGSRKAEPERFISRFARYYTPAVVAAAALTAVLPPLLIADQSFSTWLYRSLVLLVMSCPCALVISVPLAYFAGLGGAARRGIMISGANFLDGLRRLDGVVFDKTGTLTKGVFDVVDVVPADGFTREGVLEAAAGAEALSTHPIAECIRRAAGPAAGLGEGVEYHEAAGRGIRAEGSGRAIIVGNDRMLHDEGVAHAAEACAVSGTAVHVAVEGRYAGHILISDEIKADAAQAVRELRTLGVRRVEMLTGDDAAAAQAVSDALQLDGFAAELLPHEKVERLEFLAQDGAQRIAFVGDGINDAAVIAGAHIGVAMGGSGADAAIEVADVLLMGDQPSALATAVRCSRRTGRIVMQNIVFALGVKLAFVALGVAGVAGMWAAVIADMGVALAAVANATRARR